MIRDEELNRLIRYAQGMGLSVRFKPYVKNSKTAAEWLCDGTEVTIYVTTRCSKIDKILSLIHELGHHKAWIENARQVDPKVEEAINSEDEKKSYRKRILDMEIQDSEHWEQIYRDTNCRFDIEKLHKQREFDIWTYQFYYETARDARKAEKKKKWAELKRKYGF
jgi:hypothetical protein